MKNIHSLFKVACRYKLLLLFMFSTLSSSVGKAQITQDNYIQIRTPNVPIQDEALLSSASKEDVQTDIQYLDGLGRPLQALQKQASPNGRDIIVPIAYDAYGREVKKYLPYVATTSLSAGSYRPDAITEQQSFYIAPGGTTWNAPFVVSSTANTAFAGTLFEKSPLNRVLEQGAAGNFWQLSTSTVTGKGHTLKYEYTTNNTVALSDLVNTRAVTKYSILIATDGKRTLALSTGVLYSGNELFVTVTKDENWVAADGRAGTTEEYKNKESQVVLKRAFNKKDNAIEMLSTYYVYDDFGNLCFVLPPEANPDAGLPSTTTLNNFAFQYRYDERNRLVEKKLPGNAPQLIVYNKQDKIVGIQDGNAVSTKRWNFTKYDALGRIIYTGWTNDLTPTPLTRQQLQDLVYSLPQWENRVDTGIAYDNLAWPANFDVNDFYYVNYYDDYNIPKLPGTATHNYQYKTFAERPEGKSSETQGLLTATVVRSVNNSSEYWTVNYYDDEGRLVQEQKNTIVSATGSKDIINNIYSFTDQLKKSVREHLESTSTGIIPVTIIISKDYDHRGRTTTTKQKINSQEEIVLSSLTYNELGQLVDKKLHLRPGQSKYLQSVDYRYNIRGWLTSINDQALTTTPSAKNEDDATSDIDKFGMEIRYTNGTIPQYNGNISRIIWKCASPPNFTVPMLAYDYEYDKLNRFLSAISYTNSSTPDNRYKETVSYDKMGNITNLKRWAYADGLAKQIDDLNYSYTGNRVSSISDVSTSDRKDWGWNDINSTAGEITYDTNGNLKINKDKGISNITYSPINTINLITFSSNTSHTLGYEYDRAGSKLKKTYTNGASKVETFYVDGIVYERVNNSTYQQLFIQTEEGRARRNVDGIYTYEYDLKDYLGNARVTIQASATDPNDGTAEILQETAYYPFGMEISAMNYVSGSKNKYLYNGKELQEENNLGLYDYGARFYDPSIGRFAAVDAQAEHSLQINASPYAYTGNNPISRIDPDGNCWPCVIELAVGGYEALTTTEVVAATGLALGATAITMNHINKYRNSVAQDNTSVVHNAPNSEPVALPKKLPILQNSASEDNVGNRRKNRLPDVAGPNTTQTNKPNTTTKVYGPNGQVQKEYNKGHGPNAPKNEQDDHVHDHKPSPNPNNPNATERQPGRPPKPNELEKDKYKQNQRNNN
ncbi:DUF6443 domain-containing protein [Rubrolithibacter danxiaensis]|uniref:DUF6443 domain-containing protein n=1 Tax=Rubrolithibacter danxiaensis TaxID=3390805 RepID=UPI003BF81F0D